MSCSILRSGKQWSRICPAWRSSTPLAVPPCLLAGSSWEQILTATLTPTMRFTRRVLVKPWSPIWTTLSSSVLPTAGLFHLAGTWKTVADFDGDGHPDYALFNSNTGQTVIGYSSGPTVIGSCIRTDRSYRVAVSGYSRFWSRRKSGLCALQPRQWSNDDRIPHQQYFGQCCIRTDFTRWLDVGRAVSPECFRG